MTNPYIINLSAPIGVLRCNNLKQVNEALQRICYNDYMIHSIIDIKQADMYTVVYYFDMGIYDRNVLGKDIFKFWDTILAEGGQIEWVIRAYAQDARTRVDQSEQSKLVRRRRRVL